MVNLNLTLSIITLNVNEVNIPVKCRDCQILIKKQMNYTLLQRIYFYLFIYLSLAALGLCCCTLAFSSCGKLGLLFFAVRGLLIAVASLVAERGLQQLWLAGSRVQAQQLWHTGLVAPWHMGSSQHRDRTHGPCIGRWILNPCATREAQRTYFKYKDKNGLKAKGWKKRYTMIILVRLKLECVY